MGGAASGLFAEAGIEVSIAEPDPGPENIRSVAEGRADYCLTSVAHYLAARARWGNLAARFVAVVVQRSPIAALVRADSGITGVQDLAKATLGGPTGPGMGSLVAQYVAGLGLLGIEPPPIRSMDYLEAPAALGRGEVDAIADYADLLPRMRRRAGTELRAIPLGVEIYSSGLVAADSLPDASVARMRSALVAALVRQRDEPRRGLAELLARYPDHDGDDVVEGWHLVEPNIFTGAEVGSMDPARWGATIRHLAAALDLPAPAPATVFRIEGAHRYRR